MAVEPPAAGLGSGRLAVPYGLLLAAAILCGMGLLWLFYAGDVAAWRFGDPDDIMRLQEVRDWLGGQSWFDVTQYRINPPAGLSMHWSRLLDVPLGAAILLLRPFIGEYSAELAACVIVPLATYALLAALIAALTRRLLGSDFLAALAALFCAADVGIMVTARPMRIDHHGWQAVCALVMALMLLGPRTPRRAILAGLFAALWMHISLEGIVFTAGCGAWIGLQWLLRPERERAALPTYLGAIAIGSLGFFLIGHGGALFDRTFCDAISPIHMIVFAFAAVGSAAALGLRRAPLIARAAGLGATAVACALIYRLGAPQCAGGPFAALTPLTYRLWYETVREGLPVWSLPATMAAGWIVFPLIGLVGAGVGLRGAPPPERAPFIDYAALLALAFAIGLTLSRASALTNILAIPGGLMLVRALWNKAARLRLLPVRVIVRAFLVLAAIPAAPAMAVILLLPPAAENTLAPIGRDCLSPANFAHLDALPPALFLTTLDSSEALILATHHRAVSAGYHRNVASMEDTLRFFIGDDATARRMARRRHADYVLVCPGDGDTMKLAKAAPGGLAERLPKGEAPAWLRPVHVPGLRYARLYAVSD